jgi:hypothetical protein
LAPLLLALVIFTNFAVPRNWKYAKDGAVPLLNKGKDVAGIKYTRIFSCQINIKMHLFTLNFIIDLIKDGLLTPGSPLLTPAHPSDKKHAF